MTNQINQIISPIVILADDLTGALDSSCTFPAKGYRTIVHCDLSENIESIKTDIEKNGNQVLVLNTETRNSNKKKIESIYDQLFSKYTWLFEKSLLFKKVDSTARGNIGFEISVILNKMDIPYAIVCLPYPELKRIQTMGIIKAEGYPIDHTQNNTSLPIDIKYQTEKSLEIQSGLTADLITQKDLSKGDKHLRTRVNSIIESGAKIICFDSSTRQDLNQIYNITKRYFPEGLLVGSAGLAKSISESTKKTPSNHRGYDIQQKPFALISLSSHQTTKTHFSKLSNSKQISKTSISTNALLSDSSFHQEYNRITTFIENAISSKKNIALNQHTESSIAKKDGSLTSKRLQSFLSMVSAKLISYGFYKTLVLIGGDTAQTVLQSASIKKMCVVEEILPGTVISLPLAKNHNQFNIITKSGGFGDENQICELISKLL